VDLDPPINAILTNVAQAEEAVTPSEIDYRSIFENAPIGIFQTSQDGLLLSLNEQLVKMLRYSCREDAVKSISNMRAQVYVNPLDRDVLIAEVIASQGYAHRECRFYRKDRSIFVGGISLRAVRGRDGSIRLLEGFIEDITTAKAAVDTAQRQTQYDGLIRSILALFATCASENIDSSVEFALREIAQCFDVEKAYLALFSEDLGSYSCTHEWASDDILRCLKLFQNVKIGRLPFIEQEILSDKVITLEALPDEGTEKTSTEEIGITPAGIVSMLIAPIHGIAGTIIGMVGLNSYQSSIQWTDKDVDQVRVVGNAIANVIERKRADTALKASNVNLEQRIAERTGDLEMARQEAIKLMHDADEERHRAEEALAQLEFATEHLRLLSQAVDNSPAMVVIADREHRIEYVNKKFTEVTGYEAREVKGRTPFFLHPIEESQGLNQERALELGKGDQWSGELCCRRKSGEEFWEFASIAPIKGLDGIVHHYVSVKEDITERRRMQEELCLARDAAEAANRTKSLFLANMSHEIRTPMNAILGFSQLLQRSSALAGGEKQHLDIINRSGEHLLVLINDILEMSKIEAGRVVLNKDVLDLSALISDMTIMFRMRCIDKNITFLLDLVGDLPKYVNTDEHKLRQILTNLIGNAVKLTETGGVVLRVHMGETEYGACCIMAEVEDTGPGIAEHERNKVFRPFEQTASGIRSRSGTGLGLAISMQFAQIMGGWISFTSQVGVGSKFVLTVPVEKVDKICGAKSFSHMRVVNLAPGCKVKKVLVVDDETDNRILLDAILKDVGFETKEAADGIQCLRAFNEWNPDIILMDAQMPMMDGYEAIRQIRRLQAGRNIPIIAVSASAFNQDRQRLLDCGADDFLAKPLRVENVYSAIASVSGASYLYEDSSNADLDNLNACMLSADLKLHAASLPQAVKERIRQAAVDADFDTVIELVDQIADIDQSMANSLRIMAEQFEAASIIDLLSTGSNCANA
jgi:PAS domain S-box-containing protein